MSFGKIIAVDTETTGLDIRHGCRPFFVSMCDTEGQLRWWEWEVDCFTREPKVPPGAVTIIQKHLDKADKLVFHNAKFDVLALESIGIDMSGYWDKIDDTLVAAHLLGSGKSHRLKSLSIEYCDLLDKDEIILREATLKARRYGEKLGWRIAKPSDPHWPAQKAFSKSRDNDDSFLGADYWLPRMMALHEGTPNHPYLGVCREYALYDAFRTVSLWSIFHRLLHEQGLQYLYEQRIRTLEALYAMECRGITAHKFATARAHKRYQETADTARHTCLNLSNGKITNLASPNQLQSFLFTDLKCPPTKPTKTGYTTETPELEKVLTTIPPEKKKLRSFVENLLEWRKLEKAASYVHSYLLSGFSESGGLFRIHPNFNLTGTDTTRLSAYNPNVQNISKREGLNLRSCFAPKPGRVWYTIDYSNIEMRIFAYASGDKKLIEAFESGKSVHLIFCEILHPELFSECITNKEDFKVKYESSWYQWVKNGNFSLIYGASEKKADATYRVKGAYRRIRQELPLIDEFMTEKFEEAQSNGFIKTICGYPLQVSTEEPHKAVNYFVQGTAGLAMMFAINRCSSLLREFQDCHMIMTIHDELVFDVPEKGSEGIPPEKLIGLCKEKMEFSGNDLGIPTPVDVNRVLTNWSKEEKWKPVKC